MSTGAPQLFAKVAKGSRATVSVFGTDFPTPEGSAVRDYLPVLDLGRGHLLALDAARAGTHGSYNLGSGTGHSVNEMNEAPRSVTGHRIQSPPAGRRPGDPARLVASNGRIGADHGPSPEAGLRDIVADARAFMKGRLS